MGKDYYETLKICREATHLDICKAYKKLALVWHPEVAKTDQVTAYHNFCEISEAYEVLSEPRRKSFYDKYGAEKLKDGFFSDGDMKGGYHFAGNPEEIFEEFFGTQNIFSALLEEKDENLGTMLGYSFGGQKYTGRRSPDVLNVEVHTTLAELYCGCSKDVAFSRVVTNNDGVTTTMLKDTKQLEIKPGMASGEQIVYKNEGNEMPGIPSSDLVFTLKEAPHKSYKRNGNDLIYTVETKLINALCSEPVELLTLDQRRLRVSMTEVISSETVKKVDGEGMPCQGGRGDLYLVFKIEFPCSLSEDQRRQLKAILC